MDHLLIPPDPDFEDLSDEVRDHVELDLFMQGNMGDLDLLVEDRDTAIAIHDAGFTQAKDILGGRIGLG